MKILLTGASGFIGREIAEQLAERGHQVIGISRFEKTAIGETPNVSQRRADITAAESLEKLTDIETVDAVIHSAGLAHQFGETTKRQFDAVNVKGSENVLRLAVRLRAKHFILIGSTAIYGVQKNFSGFSETKYAAIDEDAAPNPQTLYAESKLAGEKICRRVCEAENIPLTIFRLAPVIGEANVGNVARLIEAIDRKRFVWIGDGSNWKSLIDKKDVARACVRLVETKRGGTEIFNLAAAPVQMKDFVRMIAERLNVKVFPFKIPALLLRGVFRANAKTVKLGKVGRLSVTVEKWLSDDVYAAEKIGRAYDFRPLTPIAETIERQTDYYRATKNK